MPEQMYQVKEIFPTIQGEGPFAGRPAVFVRLAGCNLACPKCDTDFEGGDNMPASAIFRLILDKDPNPRLVVITGGEPFRQSLGELTNILTEHEIEVQVETNGTLPPDELFVRVWSAGQVLVVCSPKTPRISPALAIISGAYKYVVEAGHIDDDDGLPSRCFGSGKGRPARPIFDGHVYLQPCDDKDPEKNKANLDAAVASCLEHGHYLCLQTHKIIGLP